MSKKRLTIKQIVSEQVADCDATVMGWVRSVRKSKTFSFIVINDGSTMTNLQIIGDETLDDYENISTMLTGTSVAIKGKLVKSQGKGQSIEMQASSVQILGTVDQSFPLQKKGTSLEFLREIAHLRSRTNTIAAVMRVRSALAFATHKFFNDKGYFYLHTPIVTGSDCEGAGEMFQVTTMDLKNLPKTDKGDIDFSKDYYGKPTNLTVSGQLEAECYALGMGAVYTFGPTFRAENSNTPRHLSEFWMIEPEIAFVELDDISELAAEYIKFLIAYTLENCPEDMAFFQKFYQKDLIESLTSVRDSEFKKVTYTEAIEILEKASLKEKFEFPVKWGIDLQTEHERYLTEKHFKAPVTVYDYPRDIKAFYMKQNDDGKTVQAMDVLVPGIGELIGGSQREDDYQKLLDRIKEMGQDEKDYWWYLELRKFGSVPHGGFGLGFERAVMYITGMSNVRDVIPFPRFPKNAEF